MPPLEEITRRLTEAAAVTGPWAPLILFFATFVEHVFPPFPGDLMVVLGAWYAVQGEISWPMMLAVTTAGAVVGALVDYQVGALLGAGLERHAARSRLLPPERLAAFDAAYQRYGGRLLLLNRFMPAIRAFLFLAAGAAHLPRGRVLVLGGLSALLWNALLLGAGTFLARNVDDLVQLIQRYTVAAGAVLALAALALAGRLAWSAAHKGASR